MIRSVPSPRSPKPTAPGALLLCCVVCVALARAAAAQDTGVVSGTVVDSTGQIVPGATVTLTNEGTASVRTATSDERGEFAFRALTPGSYTVKVTPPAGYAAPAPVTLNLKMFDEVRVDFSLTQP